MKLILDEGKKDVKIEVENPGLLEVPEGKKVYDLPVSHFKKLIDEKGRAKIIRAINNLEIWNKNDDPKISKWAENMKKSLEGYGEKKEESLKEGFKYNDLTDILMFLDTLTDEELKDMFNQYNLTDRDELAYIIKDEDLVKLGYVNEEETLEEDKNAWEDSLAQFVGRPLKDFLRTVDHRDRVSIEYGHTDEWGTGGLDGMVHDVPWNHADDIIVDVKRGTGKFHDWIIDTK